MSDQDRRMLAFIRLAVESKAREQTTGYVRFLLLAGAAACRGGYPNVSNRCRELVLAANPHHLVGEYESLADALRDKEFSPFLTRLDKFCSYEKAELLLDEMHLVWNVESEPESQCLEWLGSITERP